MRIKNFKRWVAGLCAATMLAGVPAMVGYAEQTKELTDTNPGNTTSVTADVVEGSPVNYVVAIPEKVNFGQIQQPNSAGSRYVEQQITVTCTDLTGLEEDEALAVFVKDSEALNEGDDFKLKNTLDKELVYEIINNEESVKEKRTWWGDEKGFLLGSFAQADKSVVSTLRLDRGQLYGQEMSLISGNYTGALNFTASIVRTDDNGNIVG